MLMHNAIQRRIDFKLNKKYLPFDHKKIIDNALKCNSDNDQIASSYFKPADSKFLRMHLQY